ncbi:MAG: hypothetical protein JSW64_01520 [Candidatus Zixiibacteriota bacterium]|nr:MAG: hypothetical protein JSW64_01520 [candidate division Zixibacteria bacterium]
MNMREGLKTFLIPAIIISFLVICCDGESTRPEDGIPIRITAPDDGDVLFNPVTIAAQTGSGFSITDVEFYIDGELVWIDNDRPFEYYWNIFGYENNSEHTIMATGYSDTASYTSDTVTVTISLEEGLLFVAAYRPNADWTYGVATYQNIMFVATGESGVEVIDVLDKTFPMYISRFESAGQALKVDVRYPHLFIADFSGGVIRADISDPDSLTEAGLYNIEVQAIDVAVSDDIVFVADQNGFIILDNTLPDFLVSLFRSYLFSGSNYVTARNDTAYITNLGNLYIINASTPDSPEIVFAYQSPGARGVAVIDTFAFVARGDQGVAALSISDPQNPGYLAGYVTQGAVSSVEAADSTLFVGTFSGEVIALDYTQPDTLRLFDNLVIDGVLINYLKFDSPYLYAATSQGINILRFIR